MRELTFLSKIEASTRERNLQKKLLTPLRGLEAQLGGRTTLMPLEARARSSSGPFIISEIKRRSPSQGLLSEAADPVALAAAYSQAGAGAISILTEPHAFGGSMEDLKRVRRDCPELFLLQKDFIIDAYQIFEAAVSGASAVLLIVALLGKEKLRELTQVASALGLSVLTEVHTEAELRIAVDTGAKVIGINNRDLHGLEISLDVSRRLIKLIPKETVAISESGITSASEIRELLALGFKGFLIGSSFMKTSSPAEALAKLFRELTHES